MAQSLNRIFKVIWSKVQMAWVAVSEAVSGAGKTQSELRRERRELIAVDVQEESYKAVWDGNRLTLVSMAQYQRRINRRVPYLNTPRKVVATALLSSSAVSGYAAPPAPPAGR